VKPLLVVDDDIQMISALEAALRMKGFKVETASSGSEAARKLETLSPAAVLTDLRMPGMDGLDLLRHVRRTDPEVPVILLSAFGTVPEAVEALKEGATDFLLKPFSHDALDSVLQKVRSGNRSSKPAPHAPALVTENPAMKAFLQRAASAARTRATILVQAESGTGKELLARWIHRSSTNADGPFVAVNCAALPENLLESELFGYEKGAFTGATTFKPGKFELAQNGTILLDEIGEMAPLLQAKLLRVLQEQEVDRIGGKRPVSLNVRVIATTNKDLRKLISRGLFREDLFFRLNVVPLRIPPLRERKDDIPLLVEHFIEKFGAPTAAAPDEDTLNLLLRYAWPGNVRELENVVQRALALHGRVALSPMDLLEQTIDSQDNRGLEAGQSVSDMEKKLILATLNQTSGNRTHASKLLGISLRTLRNKLREYRLEEASL
jgi:two-component system response regulator FlrC